MPGKNSKSPCEYLLSIVIFRNLGLKDLIKLIQSGSLEKKLNDHVARLDIFLSIPECPVRSNYELILASLLLFLLQVCFEKYGPNCDVYQCGLGHFVCQYCRPMLQVV